MSKEYTVKCQVGNSEAQLTDMQNRHGSEPATVSASPLRSFFTASPGSLSRSTHILRSAARLRVPSVPSGLNVTV